MLNVFLNTHCLLDYHRTGIPQYTWHLLQGMAKHPEINTLYTLHGNRLLTYYPAKFPSQDATDKVHNFLEKIPFVKNLLGKITINNFERFARKKSNENVVYVEPNFIVKTYPGMCITTLHDLTCLRFPHLQPAERVSWFEKGLAKTLAQASHIISVSEFTRQEAIRLLNIASDKITTVYNGVSEDFHPRSSIETQHVLHKHGLKYKKYFLTVSTLEPRKNLDSLIEAYLQLPVSLQQEFPLVLIGAVGWKVDELVKKIKKSEHIITLGYIVQNELCHLFSGAAGFGYISTYEGFGLPVLEALASGVPVVTSAESAMAEFSHQQAVLVNPLDINEIAMAITSILCDSKQAENALRNASYYQQNFSWQSCVEKTVEVIARQKAA